MGFKVPKLNLNKKLILYIVLRLIVSSVIIGSFSYFIAKNALERKGNIILENGVKSAIMLIEQEYEASLNSNVSLDIIHENIKKALLGPMKEDGTRQIKSPLNLGKHGYFVIYDSKGTDVMHPVNEGNNVWHLVDPKSPEKSPFYPIQDIIYKAKNGGGYTFYSWKIPFLEGYESKVAYSEYFEPWDWIVSASTYRKDFSIEANHIAHTTILILTLVTFFGYFFTKRYISNLAIPLMSVESAMKSLSKGVYQYLESSQRKDEVGKLVNGYNEMLGAIEERDFKLEHLAYYDPLTGLGNQEKTRQYVDASIGDENINGTLVLLNIENLKIINSIYGVAYVDEIVKIIANTLKNYETNELKFSRVYGNEFSLWSLDKDKGLISDLLMEIKNIIINELKTLGYAHNLTFYFGGSVRKAFNESYDVLYKNANVALHHAKENEILNYVEYEASMLDVITKDSLLLKLAEYGLQNNEFKVYYQTQVSILEGHVVGVEALSRWFSSELGFVSPGEFIPVMNRTNLMNTFSEFTIKKSLEDYQSLCSKYGNDITLSINISPKLFYQDNFSDFVLENIRRYKVNPEKIILEITEDLFISDFSLVKSKLDTIRKTGVKISLDDFGTGYSSLNYLRNLSIDEIKIDRSFVSELHEDENARSILRSIVDIAHTLEFSVVVEGIENADQLECAKKIGCEIAQGFYFSKPEPLG